MEKGNNGVRDTMKRIMEGREQIVSHRGESQYWIGGRGSSACGLAAMNCARLIFQKEAEGLHDDALFEFIIDRATMEASIGHHDQVSPLPYTPPGNYLYLRSVVRQFAPRSRRYLPRSSL
jgi:hypothetical protein